MLATGITAEEHEQAVGGAIADAHDDVRGHDVVDERNVLVADALDVVLAVAVAQERWALERLHGHGERAVALLEVVARGDRAGRAGRRDEGREAQPGSVQAQTPEHVVHGVPREGVVGEWFANSLNWLKTTVSGSRSSSAQRS